MQSVVNPISSSTSDNIRYIRLQSVFVSPLSFFFEHGFIDADASLGGRYCLPVQFTIYATKQPKNYNRQPIFIYFYLLIFSLSHTRNPSKKTENRFAGRHFLYNFVPLKYVDVILPLGIDALYTYSVPDDMEQKVVPYEIGRASCRERV